MNGEIPFRRVLSLDLLIEHWRELASGDDTFARSAATVVDAIDAVPGLAGPITDRAILEHNADLIALLMAAVFPVSGPEALGAVVPPFDLDPIFTTPAFTRTGIDAVLRDQLDEALDRHRAMLIYQYILSAHYGVDFDVVVPFEVSVADPETGLERYYRISADARFCRAVPIGELPTLDEERIEALLADRLDIGLWRESLPPDSFELHGIAILRAVDVTNERVLSLLTSELLEPDAMATMSKVDRLRDRLRTLLRRPDIELGLIRVEHDDEDMIVGAAPVGCSILLSEGVVPDCTNRGDSFYTKVGSSRTPVVIRDLATIPIPSQFERHVLARGIRNLLIAPLTIGDRLIGFMELASPVPGALHLFNTAPIRDALGLFAIAMRRMLDDRETRTQAVIKQKYTAIHPSVEWRFRQAARRYIDAADAGEYARPEPIVFPTVYPLYGLSDVRSSSVHRAQAVQSDLLEQLELAADVIAAANRARPLPFLAALDYRIEEYRQGVATGLRSGDEVRVLDFLSSELENVFRQVEPFGDTVAAALARYRAALDPDLGFLYRRRRAFEESVTHINETIGAYIDREEARAQAMFPHYFERFKTDGVDYNIYVGASLQEDGSFDPIFLRNLRLWQLMLMCGIVRELDGMSDTLPVPLEVAHLVLVHSAPLAIQFRSDEKRFDVDGAYNIRYEIVKKRIDKARVRGSREPLTQPGRIAIVYSQDREADEYREYLGFLRASGFITDGIEDLELEDLQGASGLQALRVTVAIGERGSDTDRSLIDSAFSRTPG